MNRYRVKVVASYRPEVDLMRILAEMPREPGATPGIPHIETTGEDWRINEDALIPPGRQTLTVTYEAEGRDEGEARRFAIAIFELEARRAALPDAETVVANLSDE
jgi:hypothetical protein